MSMFGYVISNCLMSSLSRKCFQLGCNLGNMLVETVQFIHILVWHLLNQMYDESSSCKVIKIVDCFCQKDIIAATAFT